MLLFAVPAAKEESGVFDEEVSDVTVFVLRRRLEDGFSCLMGTG